MDVKFKLSDELYITTMSYYDGIIKVNRLGIGVTDKAMTAIFYTAYGRFSRDIVAVEGDEVMITECDNYLWVSTSYEDAKEKFIEKTFLQSFGEQKGSYLTAVRIEDFHPIMGRFEMRVIDGKKTIVDGQGGKVKELSDEELKMYVVDIECDNKWLLFSNTIEAESFSKRWSSEFGKGKERILSTLFSSKLKGGEE